MGKPAGSASQWERLKDAIWQYPASNGPTAGDLKGLGFKLTTIYRTASKLQRAGEIEQVKIDGILHFKPVVKSSLTNAPAQELITQILRTNPPDTPVGANAWRDLDNLSMDTRFRSDALLKFLLHRDQFGTERVLRILTRQAIIAIKENATPLLGRLNVRIDQAEQIAKDSKADEHLRDAAFLYVKVLNPTRAPHLALELISQDDDPSLNPETPTQLLINLTGTIRNATPNPSVTIQLYNLANKPPHNPNNQPRQQALTILQTTNQPFTTLHTTPSQPTPTKEVKTSVKQAQKRNAEQPRTSPNNAEPTRTAPNVTEQPAH